MFAAATCNTHATSNPVGSISIEPEQLSIVYVYVVVHGEMVHLINEGEVLLAGAGHAARTVVDRGISR